MTKEQWLERQAQWERFHAWEKDHGSPALTPEERLAEIGALVDLALARRQPPRKSAQDLRAAAEGVILMRQRLACLGKAI